MRRPFPLFATTLLVLASPTGLLAQSSDAPLAEALGELGPDVQRYHEHVVLLASPFLDGRLPGTDGMELAKDYCQFWLEQAGVEPGFRDGEGQASWRQPFPLGDTITVGASSVRSTHAELTAGQDFTLTSLGSGGTAQGEAVWVGYGIQAGQDGYTSFPPNTDLRGKIALVFRFEPMDAAGVSLWGRGGRWSDAAGFAGKIDAVAERQPAAIVIVNPPGAADPRTEDLTAAGGGGTQQAEVPVIHLRYQAAAALLGGADLLALRQHFDQGGDPVPTGTELELRAELTRTPLIAENVAGLLPGKGALANEWIIIGAHLDHLGMGLFGSRDTGPRRLHPGADDNASGSAAVLMLADKLRASYAKLPADAEARSILFMLFSGEESGLNGSFYYVDHPAHPLEQTALMINFDMIGRIVNKRLQISGTVTAPGLAELVQEQSQASELEIVLPDGRGGGSDHLPFFQRRIPYLFGAIADFHDDYHTPRDVAAKINRVDGARTVALFHDIALAAAQHTAGFPFLEEESAAAAAGPRSTSLGDIKVRFGVMPGNYDDTDPGIVVAGVTPGGSADSAGIQAGDRMLRWDGQKIIGVREWMGLMAKHEPGDKVRVGIIRDGEEITLDVTLQARSSEEG